MQSRTPSVTSVPYGQAPHHGPRRRGGCRRRRRRCGYRTSRRLDRSSVVRATARARLGAAETEVGFGDGGGGGGGGDGGGSGEPASSHLTTSRSTRRISQVEVRCGTPHSPCRVRRHRGLRHIVGPGPRGRRGDLCQFTSAERRRRRRRRPPARSAASRRSASRATDAAKSAHDETADWSAMPTRRTSSSTRSL